KKYTKPYRANSPYTDHLSFVLQVRVSGTAVRRALFESERGICQLCFLDAHSLYQSVTVLSVRNRPAFLARTPYSALPQRTLKKMVMEPKEGMFWEADHITPVSEGGGECGLDNYRTLCVMCHRKATEELNRRLKQQKVLQYSAGYADISTFFRPLS
ncbi:DNA annealing helicase and endonuclease ZRANB3-like, partial [Orbicella faveolata]|uniref:DNA annealing helicase and endonuclease ZRANB3-like n=1 Tax=Orbicella faveolata TaxID=48498 RepID=UPI0009E1D420